MHEIVPTSPSIFNKTVCTSGLLDLYESSSTSAQFDAKARSPLHAGTRVEILETIRDWVTCREDRPIVWLCGAGGTGKSTIAHFLSETLAKQRRLAGSFFFSRADPSRNNPTRLFTTIASQMANGQPELRSIVNSVVLENPSILTSSIETQLERLLVQPWLKAQLEGELSREVSVNRGDDDTFSGTHSLFPTVAPILIIDALDECLDASDQLRVLSLLGRAMRQRLLPFRVFITSRPVPGITEAFNKMDSESLCLQVCLEDAEQASRDIRVFLQDKFSDILSRHLHAMEHVPRPWPTSSQIEQLVRMASGHFVFASMVVKFIDDDSAVPADRLEWVLNITGPEDHPKSRSGELDCQTKSTVLTKTTSFAHILQDTLSEIHTLLNDPSPVDSGLRFCHATVSDFWQPKWRGDLLAAPRYLRTTLNIRERVGKGKGQGLSNKKSHFMDRLCKVLSIKKRGAEFKLPLRTPLACNEKAIGAGTTTPIQILEINTQGGLEGVCQRQVSSNVGAREERVTIKEQALSAREASVVAREANIAAREASFASREAGIAAREKNISVRAKNVASREKSCAVKERNLLSRVQSIDPGAVHETGGDVLLHGDTN